MQRENRLAELKAAGFNVDLPHKLKAIKAEGDINQRANMIMANIEKASSIMGIEQDAIEYEGMVAYWQNEGDRNMVKYCQRHYRAARARWNYWNNIAVKNIAGDL